MKSISLALFTALFVTGCDSSKQAAAAMQDCTFIVSAVERLACFDHVAGTPPFPVPQPANASNSPQKPATAEPLIVSLVRDGEAGRIVTESGPRLLRAPDTNAGQRRIVITMPAAGGAASKPYLVISCLSNISRLQMVVPKPMDVNRMNIRLLLDGRPLAAARPWQVLEDGQVVDAGRGLVAIEQLRQMMATANVLRVESDYAPFDGLAFDVSGLNSQLFQQREACHW